MHLFLAERFALARAVELDEVYDVAISERADKAANRLFDAVDFVVFAELRQEPKLRAVGRQEFRLTCRR